MKISYLISLQITIKDMSCEWIINVIIHIRANIWVCAHPCQSWDCFIQALNYLSFFCLSALKCYSFEKIHLFLCFSLFVDQWHFSLVFLFRTMFIHLIAFGHMCQICLFFFNRTSTILSVLYNSIDIKLLIGMKRMLYPLFLKPFQIVKHFRTTFILQSIDANLLLFLTS